MFLRITRAIYGRQRLPYASAPPPEGGYHAGVPYKSKRGYESTGAHRRQALAVPAAASGGLLPWLRGERHGIAAPCPVLWRPATAERGQFTKEQHAQEADARIGLAQPLACAIHHGSLGNLRHVVLGIGKLAGQRLGTGTTEEQIIVMLGRIISLAAEIRVRLLRGLVAV